MAASLIEGFAAQTGMTVEYTKFDRSEDFLSAFQSGDYDCILGIPVNPSYNNMAGVITTTPYLDIQQVYFTKRGTEQLPFYQARIATLRGSNLEDLQTCKKIQYYYTTEECINAVTTGKADGGYGNQYCVEYYAQHNFLSLTILPLVGDNHNMEISVSKVADPALLALLNRYIDHLDSETIYEFHAAANAEQTNNWFRVLLYSDPVNFSVLMALVAFMVCFGIAMFFFARSSRKKSRQLQIASEAKSDFLSRVSHDMRTPMNAILSFYSMGLTKLPPRSSLRQIWIKFIVPVNTCWGSSTTCWICLKSKMRRWSCILSRFTPVNACEQFWPLFSL